MKFNKIVSLIFALLMIVSLAACGSDEAKTDSIVGKVMEIDSCTIKVTDVKLMDDVNGDPAIAVDCDFTNGTEEEASYFWTVFNKFKQNGSELELALVYLDEENSVFIDDGASENIAPGETKSITITYELVDTTNPVEVVFSDLMEDDLYNYTIDVASLN